MSLLQKLMRAIPASVFIRLQYLHHFGKLPNLKSPLTFNEKLQWLKLHDHNPLYITMVDKVKAKDYVASIIGEDHIIPTLGVWEKASEINFEQLPEQFVIKCNHDSHGVIICKDKSDFDQNKARVLLGKRLSRNGYYYGREWPYKKVEKRVIAEQLVGNDSGGLIDYKVHCFNGEPKFILVCQNRFDSSGLHEDFYDLSWNVLNVQRPGTPHGALLNRPDKLDEVLKYAKMLSKDIPFLRTDFYIVNNIVLFGELTLYPASGYLPFIPEEYDELFGSWLNLPEK